MCIRDRHRANRFTNGRPQTVMSVSNQHWVFTSLCNLDCAWYAWQFLSIIGVAPLKLYSNNNSLNTPTSQYLPPCPGSCRPSCPLAPLPRIPRSAHDDTSPMQATSDYEIMGAELLETKQFCYVLPPILRDPQTNGRAFHSVRKSATGGTGTGGNFTWHRWCLLADHFNGSSRAISQVCVSVCVSMCLCGQ